MNNQNVLALDIASTTGYAIKNREGMVSYGIHRAIATGGARKAQRWVNYRMWLSQLIQDEQIDVIFYEEVKRHVGTTAAHVYGGLLALTEMVAHQANVPMTGYGVGTIKKHFTGNGAAKKDLMIARAWELGFRPQTSDEADAIAILSLGLSFEGISIGNKA